MGEVVKSDGLSSRFANATDRLGTAEDSLRRRLQIEYSSTSATTTSTSYVDMGPTVTPVSPGPSGGMMIGLFAAVESLGLGLGIYVSFRLANGPTVVPSADLRSLHCENGGAGFISLPCAGFFKVTGLAPALYDAVMTVRSAYGGGVNVFQHSISVEPI